MERRRRERKFLDMLQENSLSRHQKGYSVAQKLGGGGAERYFRPPLSKVVGDNRPLRPRLLRLWGSKFSVSIASAKTPMEMDAKLYTLTKS